MPGADFEAFLADLLGHARGASRVGLRGVTAVVTAGQTRINHLLVTHAQQLGASHGSQAIVARLKGGDPFVLGRGSEEVLACAEAGIPVDVVPGVSSAISAPAAAGIPVTHRGSSQGFVVVTGHVLGDLEPFGRTDLTLVVLMGVATLAALADGLMAHGRDASTPVAVVERAYASDQRVTTATLGTIATTAQDAGVANPAVIVTVWGAGYKAADVD